MRVGDIVMVRFLDHCSVEGLEEPPEFLVFGRIAHISDVYITIWAWCNADIDEPYNTEGYDILQCCILDITYLEPVVYEEDV